MTFELDITAVETDGDVLTVTARGNADRDAEWRRMESFALPMVDTVRTRRAMYVGRRLRLVVTAR